MKEAKESAGPPKRDVRESRVQERFSSYMEVVTCLCESDPSTFEEAATH